MNLTVHPLTPDRLPDLEDLLGQQGAVSLCRRMYWRIRAACRRRLPEAIEAGFLERAGFRSVARHVPPRPIMRNDLRVPGND